MKLSSLILANVSWEQQHYFHLTDEENNDFQSHIGNKRRCDGVFYYLTDKKNDFHKNCRELRTHTASHMRLNPEVFWLWNHRCFYLCDACQFFNKAPEIWKWHWSAEPVEMDRLLLEHCEMYTCLAIHQSTERQVWISLMKNPKEEKNPEPVST